MMPPRPRRRRRRPRRRNREAAAAAAAAADKIYSKEAARKRRSIRASRTGETRREIPARGVESENDRTVLGTVRRVSQRLVEATESVDE